MIRQILRDPLFLQQKSSPATKDDAQVITDLTDGGFALLCNDAEDEDEGIAVCILPQRCVMDQSDYL